MSVATKLFCGRELFRLRSSRGFPLDFAIDRIINEEGVAIDWVGFIEAAREGAWWDYQTYEVIENALIDAAVPREVVREILKRVRLYILTRPQGGCL